MRLLLTSALALLLSVLTACSGMANYKEPPKGSTDVASIKGAVENKSVSNWRRVAITKIDNQSVRGMFIDGLGRFSITAGQHIITAEASFKDGFWGNGKHAYVDIPFTAVANQQYELRSSVEGAKINVWIVTASSGNRSSAILSMGYSDMPQN